MSPPPPPRAHITRPAEGVAELHLRGDKALNILGRELMAEGCTALQALAQEPTLKVLVLRAPTPEASFGGADIREMAALDPGTAAAWISQLRQLCEAVRQFPTPVIARLAGWCLGGGLELAAACDIRIAAHTTRLGMPEVKLGIPSVIHAALLPGLIGQARTQWLLLTGETITAAQALAWGLVHELHESAQLDAAVQARAASLAAMGGAVLRQQKRLLREWQAQRVDDAIAASVPEFAAAFATGEPQQHMAAFLARPR